MEVGAALVLFEYSEQTLHYSISLKNLRQGIQVGSEAARFSISLRQKIRAQIRNESVFEGKGSLGIINLNTRKKILHSC
jgi:hypothetical protein